VSLRPAQSFHVCNWLRHWSDRESVLYLANHVLYFDWQKESMTSGTFYKNFAELSQSEREGLSYRRTTAKQPSGFVVIAPHGGGIEPGTSEIARAISGSVFSYYTFEGLKQAGNEFLHITSALFDEPQCLQLVHDSEIVIAIHGCSGSEQVVYAGGLHGGLKTRLIDALLETGFDARLAGDPYAGNQSQNICNRGRSGLGAQLEISQALRRAMFEKFDRQGRKITTDVFKRFVASIYKELIAAAREMKLTLDHRLTCFDPPEAR